MFVTRKRLDELKRELHQMRLIVARLRHDLNVAQSMLHRLEGFGDDFVKTREISDRDTRLFDRQIAVGLEAEGLPSERTRVEVPADSGVRRRFR